MARTAKSRSPKGNLAFERQEVIADLKLHFPHLSSPLVLDKRYYVPTDKSLRVLADELLEWFDYFELTDAEGKFAWDEDYDCEDVTILLIGICFLAAQPPRWGFDMSFRQHFELSLANNFAKTFKRLSHTNARGFAGRDQGLRVYFMARAWRGLGV